MAKKSNPNIPMVDTKDEKVSSVVWFQGKALFHTNTLQGKYYTEHHKRLSKSDATNLLLDSIPADVIKSAIKKIMKESKSRKPKLLLVYD